MAGGACDDILATPLPPSTAALTGSTAVVTPLGTIGFPAADALILSGAASPIGAARSVAALPGGGFLYIDASNDLVREVSPDGVVTTVAGDGSSGDAPSGSLAVDSGLDGPVAVAPLPDGGFLITEWGGSVVRMVSPGTPQTATITTIAGTGGRGNSGLSGPATSMELNYPSDAVPAPGGGVLISDTYNNEIRLLSAAAPGATMTTLAGGGSGCDDASSTCDGVAAGNVELDQPDSVSPLQDGSGGYLDLRARWRGDPPGVRHDDAVDVHDRRRNTGRPGIYRRRGCGDLGAARPAGTGGEPERRRVRGRRHRQ